MGVSRKWKMEALDDHSIRKITQKTGQRPSSLWLTKSTTNRLTSVWLQGEPLTFIHRNVWRRATVRTQGTLLPFGESHPPDVFPSVFAMRFCVIPACREGGGLTTLMTWAIADPLLPACSGRGLLQAQASGKLTPERMRLYPSDSNRDSRRNIAGGCAPALSTALPLPTRPAQPKVADPTSSRRLWHNPYALNFSTPSCC
jgi:hypothetical protein